MIIKMIIIIRDLILILKKLSVLNLITQRHSNSAVKKMCLISTSYRYTIFLKKKKKKITLKKSVNPNYKYIIHFFV